MFNTILGFWDFFWIWFIIVVMAGGSRMLSLDDMSRSSIDALEQQVAALTKEVKRHRKGNPEA